MSPDLGRSFFRELNAWMNTLPCIRSAVAAAIIDVQMPGMDGYELAEHLRSDSHTADMPILFVSANYTEEHHIFRGYSAGAVDFMTKPLKPEVLLGKLRFDHWFMKGVCHTHALRAVLEHLRKEVEHVLAIAETIE